MPAATPCSSRAAISGPEVGAEPASALVNTNIDGPIRNIAPSPEGLAETPSRYQRQAEGQCVVEYHHCAVAGATSRSRWIDGSAMLTILTSSRAMNAGDLADDQGVQRLGCSATTPAGTDSVAVTDQLIATGDCSSGAAA